MLATLHIENVALIKRLDLSLPEGFSAFTGETGAGKSIIIDSIGVLCGARVSKELIRSGEAYALVEGMFSDLTETTCRRLKDYDLSPDEDGILYLSRKITAEGKSTARINAKAVPTSLLREITAFLINIHGQHDNQELLKKERHLSILDAYADNEDCLRTYAERYANYRALSDEYKNLVTDDAEKQRTAEMLRFQIEDIRALKLKPGEEETLTAEKKRLANIEKIAENAHTAYGVLFANNLSAAENVDHALSCLANLAKMSDGMDEYIDRLEKARSEIYDIAESLHDLAGDAEENPSARLDKIEQRLYDIYKLKRKYGHTVEAILAYADQAEKRLSDLELSEVRASELEKELKKAEADLKAAAQALTAARTAAGEHLKKEIEKEFEFLEMNKVRFSVQILPKEPGSDGADDIEFMVRTNVGLPFSPLAKTASGGELSRIMLAIKSVIAKKDGVETVIYDEVDVGISGKTSRRIGIKLLQSARDSQVMCVTHSAQIASLADAHFLVAKAEKDGSTETSVRALSPDKRIDETARIIAGINLTSSSRAAAAELIDDAKNYR